MVTALVPFFSGDSPVAHSDREKRWNFLDLCLDSLVGFADRIIVGVCEDLIFPYTDAGVEFLFCEPEFLPATFFRKMQGRLSLGDLVYCSEADQVLHWSEEALEGVSESDFLVPYRFERNIKQENGFGGGFLASVDLFKRVSFSNAEFSPIEHSMYWDVRKVADPFQVDSFWVDHLSGVVE